jgi:hypothetical protein
MEQKKLKEYPELQEIAEELEEIAERLRFMDLNER